ncbi:MAG TPA: HlyD family efflux transporter periplasmic adaptor subunit [Opitutus sp.]|nr:HlyD family efflux transporter periplasmic adaptor subunit [Opitutus sp.]
MVAGAVFQRLLQANLESLGYKDSPEQENAFQRARKMVVDQRKPLVLPPNTRQAGPRGSSAFDSPAPDELSIFNQTPFEQVFVPIPMNDGCAGILHVWFQPTNPAASHARVTILRQLCNEIELYLKTRRARDASHEVTRVTTYARLLEELTGDIDLDSVSWKLVNYAREAVACERVCLFIASDYHRVVQADPASGSLDYEFRLQACSGLKRPHPKSEQAVVLQHVAQKLTEMSMQKATTENAAPAPAEATAADNTANPAPGNHPAQPAKAAPDPVAPRMQLTLMMRDPSKTATRPPEVNDYFEVMPMNWATVIPLLDRENRVCGILLFEGVKLEEKIATLLKPMLDLAASAGKALGTTLYCTQHRSMRIAHRTIALRREYVNTPLRRKLMRFGLPVLVIVAILALPVPYNVRGNASVLPVTQNTLPSLVNARLLEVTVREGQMVEQGEVLARFDTRDIQLQLSQAEQEYQRSLVESDAALTMGNEAQMQIARLNAEKAAAAAEKLRLDLSRAVMRAPFTGMVLGAQTLSTRIGEVLRMGEPALEVVDPSAWQVKASLKERDLIYLDRTLAKQGEVFASLRLSANPAREYELSLERKSQLAYGLDTTTGEYQFTAMLPLNTRLEETNVLKAGFTGRVTFKTGTRALAYVMFSDFINFLTVRFF